MRLRRSDCASPGIRRRRVGRGFAYSRDDGRVVTEGEKARVKGLAVPPAWREVWICPHPSGHIQAVGVDDAGRRQYLYHDQWREDRDAEKHERVLVLARRMPGVRERIEHDLGQPGLTRERVLAGALRILDRGVFRVGGEEYAEENDSRGVSTLLRGHVTPRAGELHFAFPAKSGQHREATIKDPLLGKLIVALRRGRADDDRLFHHRDGEIHAGEVNERFKEFAGDDFTVKDMRTWTATVLAATEFAAYDGPPSKRAVARVMRTVAEQLGNTPAMARKSYVDPRVVDAFTEGRTIPLRRATGEQDVRVPLERAVLRLLRA
ncbi:DNA topoisomerase IB [Actinokineospora cianjurensis]|uniref:DNA topoisomerase n=1 Tax=Actinokineospora cianjurensis TaxID=585224 RepID=A0A421AW21_9PSEU|nr:DNA topoisomerase IB [Actinokineospora cianjurensis]RLK54275.1 DNA topoisomerase IB [Actinokineospora cianjurensis]